MTAFAAVTVNPKRFAPVVVTDGAMCAVPDPLKPVPVTSIGEARSTPE